MSLSARFISAASVLALLGACAAPPPLETRATAVAATIAPAAAVQVIRGEWRDPARDRTVPYKLYLPATTGPAPVVIFSHGLGGSREAATFLLQFLAEHGFAVLALQHPGSDSALLAGATDPDRAIDQLRVAVGDPRAAVARFGDIPFAIDQLTAANASGPLAGRFDLSRIGMSGHSYGALTTLVSVGQKLQGPRPDLFREPRIKAAIVYSPNAPRNQDAATVLADIRTPMLHFTGTADSTPFDLEATPEGRQVPFRTITGSDQYLIVFEGGDHMIYSGRVQSGGAMTEAQQRQTEAIERETLAFWRAYLLGDPAALTELCGLPGRIALIGAAEVKAPRCAGRG